MSNLEIAVEQAEAICHNCSNAGERHYNFLLLLADWAKRDPSILKELIANIEVLDL